MLYSGRSLKEDTISAWVLQTPRENHQRARSVVRRFPPGAPGRLDILTKVQDSQPPNIFASCGLEIACSVPECPQEDALQERGRTQGTPRFCLQEVLLTLGGHRRYFGSVQAPTAPYVDINTGHSRDMIH